jgi:predicted glycogen debranching enzyme
MKLPAINLPSEALLRFDETIQKEWLVTNGLGGYASSTVLGINTRKYHGLLVATLHPLGDRTVCLAKLDEEVYVGSNIYPLGANEVHGKIFPQGYLFLKEFSVSPFPSYAYSVQDVEIRKTVFMPEGKNAVAVTYKVLNRGGAEAKIRVYPLLTCRHFHSVVDRGKTRWTSVNNKTAEKSKLLLTLRKPQLSYAPPRANSTRKQCG